ncbi:MAG: hypothetical protein ABH873_05710 [Candidatus Firestonebacteria bacterium]
MRFKCFIIYIFLGIFLFSCEIFSQDISKISFALLNSKRRRIDKEGGSVPREFKKYIINGIGVGNILFSDKPLEIENTTTSIVPFDKFDYNEIVKGLYALSYFPGKKKDLIEFIEAKYFNYKFEGVFVTLRWQPLKSTDKKSASVLLTSDYKSLWNDQEAIEIRSEINGTNFQEVNLLGIPEYGSSMHNIEIFFFLRFTTGTITLSLKGITSNLDLTLTEESKGGTKIQKTIKKVGDSTLNEEATYSDFLFAWGKCTVTYKE